MSGTCSIYYPQKGSILLFITLQYMEKSYVCLGVQYPGQSRTGIIPVVIHPVGQIHGLVVKLVSYSLGKSEIH